MIFPISTVFNSINSYLPFGFSSFEDIFFNQSSAIGQMSVVHETLKVNDELSVEVDVIYENGEKYVQENTIWTNVDGKKPSFYVSTPYFDSIECKVEIPTDPDEWCRGPKLTKAVELYKMEYINALSYQINQEYYFNFLYNCEDEVRIINLWNLWYDVDVEKLVSTWKHRYTTSV